MNFPIKCFVIVSIFLLLFTIGCSGESSKSDFPKTCVEEGIKFENNNLVLNEGSSSKQSLYLLHNISDENLFLNHPLGKDPGASAGWSSILGSGNWSAIAMNTGNFEFNCSKMGTGEVEHLNCKEVVKICKFEKPVFNSENSGSFWVAENKLLSNLLDAIKSREISW